MKSGSGGCDRDRPVGMGSRDWSPAGVLKREYADGIEDKELSSEMESSSVVVEGNLCFSVSSGVRVGGRGRGP